MTIESEVGLYLKRVFLIVMDSVGIGEAPDAAFYNDIGADTLGHIAEVMNGIHLPNLEKLGMSNIKQIKGLKKQDHPYAHYTKMKEISKGKDTMTGHWELMGLRIDQPFRTFPDGFPETLIHEIEMKTNREVIGNKVASGTAIIEELGKEHMKTGKIIVYTSADSVLQVAAHEEIVPIDELYNICKVIRSLTLEEPYMVGRIIARPFIGTPGSFIRTANRQDYALKPFGRTVMDELSDSGYDVIGLGKIADIFDGQGITRSIRTIDNDDGMTKIINMANTHFHGLCFLNLVDFDSKYGHRRDPIGYGQALEAFDKRIPELLHKLNKEDLLIITADHGNDPTHHGTDHTREYVPLLIYHKRIEKGKKLPARETFADVGATIADCFQIPSPPHGTSFLPYIL